MIVLNFYFSVDNRYSATLLAATSDHEELRKQYINELTELLKEYDIKVSSVPNDIIRVTLMTQISLTYLAYAREQRSYSELSHQFFPMKFYNVGNLAPYELIATDWEVIASQFVDTFPQSITRSGTYEALQTYLIELKSSIGYSVNHLARR